MSNINTLLCQRAAELFAEAERNMPMRNDAAVIAPKVAAAGMAQIAGMACSDASKMIALDELIISEREAASLRVPARVAMYADIHRAAHERTACELEKVRAELKGTSK